MTLVLKPDLDMVKMHLYTKMKFLALWFKRYSLNRQSDKQTQLKLLPTAYVDGKKAANGKSSTRFQKNLHA